MTEKFLPILKHLLLIISLISIFGSITYHLYSLNAVGLLIALFATILSYSILTYFQQKHKLHRQKPALTKHATSKLEIWTTAAYFTSSSGCFWLLFSNQTNQAIISPWSVVPIAFFLVYAAATAKLSFNLYRFPRSGKIWLISWHFFLTLSVAAIVYSLGYGFDPFIHQASMEVIDKQGVIEPKTIYYIGQYAIILSAHKFLFLPIVWLNRFLVPLLAALILPILTYSVFLKWSRDKRRSLIATLLVMIFPASFFIVTTPQNLAYLFLVAIILIDLNRKSIFDLAICQALAAAAFTIQPVAGLPALLFVAISTFDIYAFKGKKVILTLLYLTLAAIVPLSFLSLSGQGTGGFETGLPVFSNPGQEPLYLNFLYLYGFNLFWIFGLFVLAGMAIAKQLNKLTKFKHYLGAALALFVSFLLMQYLPFNYLIEYERGNYADRLLILSALFLLPFALLPLIKLTKNIVQQTWLTKTSLLGMAVCILTASLYFTYPRFDHYFNSRGYSVGCNDIAAVQMIDDMATSEYIVLANQQVAAAALHEFGFKKYYHQDIFFYPIPTGGPLYQYFLDMVYKQPDSDTMKKAMDLAGVSESYFVLNRYWWAFPKLLEEAKLSADSWQELGNGEIYIFKYTR